MIEIWKPIKDYEGLYEVSNMGRVRSLDRVVIKANGVQLPVRGQILSAKPDKYGYPKVNLSKSNIQRTRKVHRLVAETFIPNPDDLPEINHKNEVKTDNRVENLEWCNSEHNQNWGTHNYRSAASKGKPVMQFGLNGEYIATYPSIREAERKTGVDNRNIGKVCKGIYKQCNGFIWKYKD